MSHWAKLSARLSSQLVSSGHTDSLPPCLPLSLEVGPWAWHWGAGAPNYPCSSTPCLGSVSLSVKGGGWGRGLPRAPAHPNA